ncbi:MAG: hypothetical protein LKG25_04675 [Prevotella sp.]|jgi:hypothetical protein|nr:hypothetical protein [Prevotella sp.]MCI1281870.1 hypothetical protein [Prevotella sp.]
MTATPVKQQGASTWRSDFYQRGEKDEKQPLPDPLRKERENGELRGLCFFNLRSRDHA